METIRQLTTFLLKLRKAKSTAFWGQTELVNLCRRVARSTPEPPVAAVPATPEPPVRRWPHPVEGVEPIQDLDPALHYIRCALSYQNQLLADIKTPLQQLVPEETREDAENS